MYLAACDRVVTPVTCLTPVTGVSLCVGGADALATLGVAVPAGVITAACWEEKPIRDERIHQSAARLTCYLSFLSTCAAVGMETIVTMGTAVTLVSSHTSHTLAPPLIIT